MFWTLNPIWFYVGIGGVLAVIFIHTVANRLAPKIQFSWVGFFDTGITRASFLLKVRDYLVLLLRCLTVLLLFLILAKPFLYNGKPPREIWVKDIPFDKVAEIYKKWGKFSEIRFSPSQKPKGKVALVGVWNEVPPVEYEVWSSEGSWKILSVDASSDRINIVIKTGNLPVKLKIHMQSPKTTLSDEIEIPKDTVFIYSASGNFMGDVIINIGYLTLYDYVLEKAEGGRVYGRGMDGEVIYYALKTTKANLKVGVDTVFKGLDIVFTKECKILDGLGLNYERGLVEFLFPDSGCVFRTGKPLLYDKRGNLVGVEYKGLKVFGFSPAYTGWGFTPEFLRFLSVFSRNIWKVYAFVGDSVKLGDNYTIKGKTSICCPDVFRGELPGIYRVYKGNDLKGIIVVNEKVGLRIPEPPKPLNNHIKIALILAVLLEMLLTFSSLKFPIWKG